MANMQSDKIICIYKWLYGLTQSCILQKILQILLTFVIKKKTYLYSHLDFPETDNQTFKVKIRPVHTHTHQNIIIIKKHLLIIANLFIGSIVTILDQVASLRYIYALTIVAFKLVRCTVGYTFKNKINKNKYLYKTVLVISDANWRYSHTIIRKWKKKCFPWWNCRDKKTIRLVLPVYVILIECLSQNARWEV